MPTKEQQREKLIGLLKELFQLDQPDLDFGFYKIMHAKAKEVTAFLENDLLKIVEEKFGQSNAAKVAQLQKAYEDAVAQAKSFGAADPEQTEPVKRAKAALEAAQDTTRAEAEVYDHLYRFFERYYDAGDFMSRRYLSRETSSKAAPYAVPYDGSEVYLHWANKDQYYIKTAEYLTNFTFDPTKAPEVREEKVNLFGETEPAPMLVHFRVVAATEGEHGNIKANDAAKRYFILHQDDPVTIENGELIVRFEYRPDPDKTGKDATWQAKRNGEAVAGILEALDRLDDARAKEYSAILKVSAPIDKKDRPLLAKYVVRYTARNTMDYFIHKDLGCFLRRELDFYIKNEVMRLDDIASADVSGAEQYLAQVTVLRQIAEKMVSFLARLEDFQRRLWLKRKFIVESHYCVTLDLIPEALYPDITANDAQREEWVRLFGIDGTAGDLVTPAYTVPLTVEFLKANSKLPVDTQFFSRAFTSALLGSIGDLDSAVGGLLVRSDNFQALRLLTQRYCEQVKCVYIDPPYNTDASAIPYKNNYRHSSWATMMHDRVSLLRHFLPTNGVLFVSIDKNERTVLEYALDSAFGACNRVEELIWVQNTNDGRSPTYSTNHEYIEVYAKHRPTVEADKRIFREPKPGFVEVAELIRTLNPQYAPINEIEEALARLYRSHRKAYRESVEAEGLNWEAEKRNDPWKGIYQYKFAEYRDRNGRWVDPAFAKESGASIWVYRESDWTIMSSESKQSDTIRDSRHPNYRFYEVVHPVTKKACAMPSRGWKGTQFIDPQHPERNSFESLVKDHRIAFGPDESKVPQQKRMLHEVETNVSKSVFYDYSDGEKETTALFGRTGVFLAPKHTNYVRRLLRQVVDKDSTILDCFGGSGSTAHAVIRDNREDGDKQKYILVEVNNYFNSVLKPRVLKAAYAGQWEGGKPTSQDGLGHCVKVLRLESYEDCLNNLEINDDPDVRKMVEQNSSLREDYMLHYMLDVETRGSASLLNIDRFVDPTAYKLKVKKPGSDEYDWRNVDLLETFNYLIGMRVEHIAAPQAFTAQFDREKDPDLPKGQLGRLVLKGRLKQDANGRWWFRKVEGWVPKNPRTPNDGQREKVLIVWRKLTGDIEQDNLVLDEWFRKYQINPRESYDYDTIYVNGSNNLPNLKLENETWRVRLIEEDFHRLMWDIEEI
jgi:adenine-specific DNA-methyltransferase